MCRAAVRYYYPGRLLGWELTTIFLFLFIDGVRLLLGRRTSIFTTTLIILTHHFFFTSIEREQDVYDTSTHFIFSAGLADDSFTRVLYFLADVHVRAHHKVYFDKYYSNASFFLLDCGWTL